MSERQTLLIELTMATTNPHPMRQLAQVAQEIRLQYGPDVLFYAEIWDKFGDPIDMMDRQRVGDIPEVK